VSDWVLAPNPVYAGKTPRILEAACHDRTPFLTIRCSCGNELHVHESQIEAIAAATEIAVRCISCGNPLVFPPGYLAAAFQQLRDEGWIL
jgi:ribosomal protein S27E